MSMLSSCLLVTTDSQAYRNTNTLRPTAEQIDIATYMQTITHTHTHTHTHTDNHTYTHTHTHTHTYIYIHTHTHAHTQLITLAQKGIAAHEDPQQCGDSLAVVVDQWRQIDYIG